MALDFSGLNRIAKRDPAEAALTERGYTIVTGEPLPFDEETPPSSSPLKVEVSQLFGPDQVAMFSELYKAGQIELLDQVIYYRKTGAFYAHFNLVSNSTHE